MKNIFVSEVIATRLSHDLIGNIGAVANAVELFNEGDEDDIEDIRNILNFSSTLLSRRLKFFRLCFGLSNSAPKDVENLKSIISDYLLTLGNPNFPITLELDISSPQVYKIIMPAIMMMADTIVKGGKIIVSQKEHGLYIQAISDHPLNNTKLAQIDAVIEGQEITENPSTYAPLYYLLSYLEESQVPVLRKQDTLIIGE